jgi:hypothetical protein
MSTPTPQRIIHAYRNLYRGLLHAVQYSKPARYVARDQLRKAFRTEEPSSFNQEKIDRTVKFLGFAARETGLEHRIVRNLLHTAYWEKKKYIFERFVVAGKGLSNARADIAIEKTRNQPLSRDRSRELRGFITR